MSETVEIAVTLQTQAVEIEVHQPTQSVVLSPTQYVGMPGQKGDKGDKGDAGSVAASTVEGENKSGGTIYAGQAVAQHSSGVGFVLADKSASGTRCVGLAQSETAAGFTLSVQTEDILELADWSTATGSPSLAALSRYYLSGSGQLTTTPPSAGGEYLQFVGEPVSPQKLAIRIAEPIRRS